jgi:hypothetical protein
LCRCLIKKKAASFCEQKEAKVFWFFFQKRTACFSMNKKTGLPFGQTGFLLYAPRG